LALHSFPTRRSSDLSGFYVVDTLSKNVYFVPAAQLAPYAGKVLVASELGAHFWVLEPAGKGFKTTRLATNLRGGKYNLEGGRFLDRKSTRLNSSHQI